MNIAQGEPAHRRVLLLAAHGSSVDAEARERVQRLAGQVALLVPHDEVLVGFARGSPSIREVVETLVCDPGAPSVSVALTVVPVMTSAGYYAGEVLPKLLRKATERTATPYVITKALGAHPRVASILHRRALRCARQAGWDVASTSLLLVAHGTRRRPDSRATTLAHRETLRRGGWLEVAAAFIDDDPEVPLALRAMTGQRVVVLPFMMGGASHTLEDIPDALGVPRLAHDGARRTLVQGREVLLDDPMGIDPQLPMIVAALAQRAWSRAARPRRQRYHQDAGGGATRLSRRPRAGWVALVGAGPGAADLLTIRAKRLLRRATVVIHDRLVSPELLRGVRANVVLIDVGKQPHTPQQEQEHINQLLVQYARAGARVVRLKGGDPMVFGRGSEELAACQAAGIRVAVVPGISSALAAPAAIGIPVTARHISRSVAIVTAATATDTDQVAPQISAVAHVDTVVVLMGHARLGLICRLLQQAGRAASTPVACIERGTLPGQRSVRGTLATIEHEVTRSGLGAPMVIVIGPTAHAPAPTWDGVLPSMHLSPNTVLTES